MFVNRLLAFLGSWGLLFLIFIDILFLLAAVSHSADSQNLGYFDAFLVVLSTQDDKAEGFTKLFLLGKNIILLWAAIKISIGTVGERWNNFFAKYLSRGHVVIVAGATSDVTSAMHSRHVRAVGGGKTALAIDLALELALQERGRKVLLLLPQLDEPTRTQLWEAGVQLIVDDIPQSQIALATGMRRANMLIAMREDFESNLALCRIAMSPKLGSPVIECKCMIEPLSFKQKFRAQDYFEVNTLPRLRVFNEAEIIARRLISDYPPDVNFEIQSIGTHLLLVGFGTLGQAVVVQLARIGHYRNEAKPKVTIIDRNVDQLWSGLIEQYPAITEILDVQLEKCLIENIGRTQVERWCQGPRKVTRTYVCTKNEVANLRVAKVFLSSGFVEKSAPIVVLDPPGGTLIAEYKDYGAERNLDVFSLVNSSGHRSNHRAATDFLTDVDDEYPKLMHLAYRQGLEEARNKNPTGTAKTKPNDLPWEELDEQMRDANRVPADHYYVKLRALDLIQVQEQGAPLFVLSSEELELFADMEHRRWCADRLMAGWVYNDIRNDELKHHPDLIPYKKLTDETKKYDRDQVILMMKILQQDDWRIKRKYGP